MRYLDEALLRFGHPRSATRAAKRLARRPDERSIAALMATLQRSGVATEVVKAVDEALVTIGAPCSGSLVQALRSDVPSPSARRRAADLLGQIPCTTAVEGLLGIVSDSNLDHDLRRRAIASLRALKDQRSVGVLVRCLDERRVGDAAATALGVIGDPSAVPALIAHLSADYAREAIWALGEIGDARATQPLMETLKVRGTRPEALMALGKLGGVGILDVLVGHLQSSDSDVMTAAVQALGELCDPLAAAPLVALRSSLREPTTEHYHYPGGPSTDGYYWYEPYDETKVDDPDAFLRTAIDKSLSLLEN